MDVVQPEVQNMVANNMDSFILLGILSVVALIIALVGSYLIITPKHKVQKTKAKFVAKFSKWLYRFPLTSPGILKIRRRYSSLSVFSKEALDVEVFKAYMSVNVSSMAVIIIGLFFVEEITNKLLIIFFSQLFKYTLLEKRIDKVTLKVYKNISRAIAAVRDQYLKTKSIPDSIGRAEIPAFVRVPFEEMYNIITSTDQDERLAEFYERTPFKILQTFMGIAIDIDNEGDEQLESGEYNFVRALNILSSDINFEIERLDKIQREYAVAAYLPMIPVIAGPFIEGSFADIVPGVVVVLKSSVGYFLRASSIIIAIICFWSIQKLVSPRLMEQDDINVFIYRLLLKRKWFRWLVDGFTPKNKSAKRVDKLLRESLSKMDIRHLYGKKLLSGFIAFILAISVSILAVEMSKDFAKNNVNSLSLIANKTGEAKIDKNVRRQLDEEYLKIYGDRYQRKMDNLNTALREGKINGVAYDKAKAESVIPIEESVALVKQYMPKLTEMAVYDEVYRMNMKADSIYNAYYRYWFIFIAFGVALVGYQIPNLQLKLRRYMIKYNAKEDFLQLQTLTTVLMSTNADIIGLVKRLAKNSTIHKQILNNCYYSLPSDPEKELTRLQSKTPLEDFKQFINSMKLAVDDLSLKEAFSDLLIQRDHIIAMRREEVLHTIRKKKVIVNFVSMAPTWIMVINSVVIPLGLTAAAEMARTFGNIGGL